MPFIGIIHHKDMVGKKMYDEYIGYDVVLPTPLWFVFRTRAIDIPKNMTFMKRAAAA